MEIKYAPGDIVTLRAEIKEISLTEKYKEYEVSVISKKGTYITNTSLDEDDIVGLAEGGENAENK